MLKHYFTIGWRSLWRHRAFSSINILGLAIGLACCLLMLLYVKHELSFDQFHADKDRIYRVWTQFHADQGDENVILTPNIVGPMLKRNFPEQVEATVRTYRMEPVMRVGEKVFREKNALFVDSTFFQVFGFELLRGDPQQVLTAKRSLVLTRSAAHRYFGTEDPIGQVIEVGSRKTAFQVTGLMADPPPNSHLEFTLLGSFHTYDRSANNEIFGSANYLTYLKVDRPESGPDLQAKLKAVVKQEGGEEVAERIDFFLQPLTDIYLASPPDLDTYGYAKVGDMSYIYLFSSLAIVILLIAAINYINLTTARSVDRAREVGLRKVIGARRGQLIQQFIGETVLVALIALVLGLMLMRLALPIFEQMVDRELVLNQLAGPRTLAQLFLGSIILGLLAGFYPALVLSGFQPMAVLRGKFGNTRSGVLFRKSLVVFQFSISVVLIAGAIIIQQQLAYVQSKKLGYDRERMIVINQGSQPDSSLQVLRNALASDPGVLGSATATESPHQIQGGYAIFQEDGKEISVTATMVDDDFIPLLDMELIAGRNYTEPEVANPPAEGDYRFIVNEATLRLLGLSPEEAIGHPLDLHSRQGVIQGVVADFHFASLHQEIGPLVMFNDVYRFQLLVRLAPGDVSAHLARVRKLWQQHQPGEPFTYTFLDSSFDALYRSEQQASQFAKAFAGLAILIAILGLLGLAAYTMVQRRKEIGIRKVLGAKVSQIVGLLSREFTLLVLLAFLIGVPVCIFLMQSWLSDFAYRIELGWEAFALTGALSLLVAWSTVCILAYHTARRNPVEAIRTEG